MPVFFWRLIPLLLLFVLLEWSCANRVPPTGGAKDVIAPHVLKSNPPDKSLSFVQKQIRFSFDELIDLQNAGQILISPLLKEPPEFSMRGKSLVVNFKEPLDSNTTYTINFGESLRDFNEGNILKGFEYSFSTGSVRDSLSVRGNLQQARDNAPAKEVLIALYAGNPNDTLFLTQAPKYLARTAADGNFNINNVSAGTYRLYALLDQNGNYYYDQPNESIAFADEPIQVSADDSLSLSTPQDSLRAQKAQNRLRLFSEGKEKSQLIEADLRDYGLIRLIFSKPVAGLQLYPLDSTLLSESKENYLIEPNANADTVQIWYRDVENNTDLNFALSDTSGLKDTVRLSHNFPPEKALPPECKTISSIKVGRDKSFLDQNQMLWVGFSMPVEQIDKDKIKLFADTLPLNIKTKLVKGTLQRQYIAIDYRFAPNVKYQLLVPDSTAISYFGEPNEELELNFEMRSEETYGTLQFHFLGFDATHSYIFQLLDASGKKILREQKLEKARLELKLLNPGQYQVFVIEDSNNNMRWDTGDYKQHRQPEKVYNTKTPVQIKSNWDTELEMK